MFDLSGKHAFVTGASGGLGGAMARALHAQGAAVVLSGTKREALDRLKGELGERSFLVTGDLADPAAPALMLKEAEAQLGATVDILINNAGLTRDGLAMRMKDEEWDAVLNVNLSAAFRLTRAALRGMAAKRWGRVINITSVVGVTGNGGQANYAASKAGLIGMTKSLAQEMAPRNVTLNCIAPGFIASAMTDVLTDDQKKRILGAIPAGVMGDPKDIAAAAVFLASDEARYVTGQTLHVNGGMAMI